MSNDNGLHFLGHASRQNPVWQGPAHSTREKTDMKLHSLKVQHFRAIENSTFDFTDNLSKPKQMNLIVGPNGTGKTSILDAIHIVVPEQVAKYLSHAKTKKGTPPSPATLNTWLAALKFAHKALGFSNPCESLLVRQTLKGIKRVHGTAQRQARPLLKKEVVSILPTDMTRKKRIKTVRDTALILIGFSGMFRCSELVNLQIADLTETDEGMVILLRQSKTDQNKQGRKVGIPRANNEGEVCPVEALNAWLEVLKQHKITKGTLFRNLDRKNGKGGVIGASLAPASVSILLKKHAEKAGN